MGHSRAIEAALRWSAMTEHTPGVPLGAWLADLPDERLIRLLELRPDLAQPSAGQHRGAGGARAGPAVGQGRHRRPRLSPAGGARRPAGAARRHRAGAVGQTGRADRRAGARKRRHRGARRPARPRPGVGRHDDAGGRRGRCRAAVVSRVRSILEDPRPHHAEITAQIEKLDAPERELLDRLLEGSPVGRTRDAAPEPRRTARCSDCWPPACCGRWTPTR